MWWHIIVHGGLHNDHFVVKADSADDAVAKCNFSWHPGLHVGKLDEDKSNHIAYEDLYPSA